MPIKKYKFAQANCNKWYIDPITNPISRFPIDPDKPRGVAKLLKEQCKQPKKIQTSSPQPNTPNKNAAKPRNISKSQTIVHTPTNIRQSSVNSSRSGIMLDPILSASSQVQRALQENSKARVPAHTRDLNSPLVPLKENKENSKYDDTYMMPLPPPQPLLKVNPKTIMIQPKRPHITKSKSKIATNTIDIFDDVIVSGVVKRLSFKMFAATIFIPNIAAFSDRLLEITPDALAFSRYLDTPVAKANVFSIHLDIDRENVIILIKYGTSAVTHIKTTPVTTVKQSISLYKEICKLARAQDMVVSVHATDPAHQDKLQDKYSTQGI